MAFSPDEIQEFTAEARELLDGAEQALLSMDGGGAAGPSFDSVFRAFHNIKGAAGMMELGDLQSHMHQLETLLTRFKGDTGIPKEIVDFFLRGVDGARSLLDGKRISFSYDLGGAPPAEKASPEAPTPAPRAPQAQPDSRSTNAPLAASPTVGARGKVVIIDDEGDIVECLQDILQQAGFEACGFTSPTEALNAIPNLEPDAVLSDISMPGLSGVELLEALRRLDSELPVIFVSGYVNKDILLRSVALGVYGVIEKPFTANHVVQTCLTACERSRMSRLLNKSINLLLYQYTDLDKFLQAQGQEEVRKLLKEEIRTLLDRRQRLKKTARRAV